MVKPFKLSIKVLIRDPNGRYLLLKRSASCKANVGKWDLPGGKVEPGEGFEETLHREVAEETGLAVSLQRAAGMAQSELTSMKVVYLFMEGDLAAGEIQLSAEHDDYLWVTPSELLTLDVVEQFRSFAMQWVSRIQDLYGHQ
jgi:8-oxo-dGTP diphosphatase